jgi:hypothetical protein
MKTLMKLRKRLGHSAIGPLVGAIVAGILLIVLMLNINNDQDSIRQTKGEKHVYVSVPVRVIHVS